MSTHVVAFGVIAAILLSAAAWVLLFAYVSAARTEAGENVVVLFSPGMSAAEVASQLAIAPVRQFVPLGVGNAWVVQAAKSGLAGELKQRGAVVVLRTSGPIHFALGCGVNGPIRRNNG